MSQPENIPMNGGGKKSGGAEWVECPARNNHKKQSITKKGGTGSGIQQ